MLVADFASTTAIDGTVFFELTDLLGERTIFLASTPRRGLRLGKPGGLFSWFWLRIK
jgi:hypothetical protein